LEKIISKDNSIKELIINNLVDKNKLSGYAKKILFNIESSSINKESIVDSLKNYQNTTKENNNIIENNIIAYIESN
jgi:hypothetical protein